LTTSLACCGFVAAEAEAAEAAEAAAANIPMIDATITIMVSNVVAAFLITVVPSHHCYYDQVY
jgi:hypothetical protein